jgi:NAD(P)-dependent dehydrogenase (short-subunit alcohol dehydrogenase family)
MTIVITGATSGIGLATAERLVSEGHDVVLIGRRHDSAQRAARLVRYRVTPEAMVTSIAADLARPHDVHRVSEQVACNHGRLHGLVLCAAVMNPEPATTDGVDTTLAVNHLSPALLATLLDRAMPVDRILLIGSSQYVLAGEFDPKIFAGTNARAERRYEATKLLNLLFAQAWARRPHQAPMEVIDPGFVRTNLGRNATGRRRALLAITRPLQSPPARPAALIAHRLRADDFHDGSSQGFKGLSPSASNVDDASADRAWAWTESLLRSPTWSPDGVGEQARPTESERTEGQG